MELMKKVSFADLVEHVGAEKQNSDLLNLAHALTAIKNTRRELDKAEADIRAMVTAIEGGEEVDVGELHALYNRAHGRSAHLRR